MKNTALMLLVLTGIGFTAAACNTVDGMGEDVSATGNAIQRSSK